MTNPEIGREPIAVEVEAVKIYWWCACGRSKSPAVLRRLAQDDHFRTD